MIFLKETIKKKLLFSLFFLLLPRIYFLVPATYTQGGWNFPPTLTKGNYSVVLYSVSTSNGLTPIGCIAMHLGHHISTRLHSLRTQFSTRLLSLQRAAASLRRSPRPLHFWSTSYPFRRSPLSPSSLINR